MATVIPKMEVILQNPKHTQHFYRNIAKSNIDDFSDCTIICSDRVLSYNRLLPGLAFPELSSSPAFSFLPEVTVIMDQFTESEVIGAVNKVAKFWKIGLQNGETNGITQNQTV